jgi:hypothetical protein
VAATHILPAKLSGVLISAGTRLPLLPDDKQVAVRETIRRG